MDIINEIIFSHKNFDNLHTLHSILLQITVVLMQQMLKLCLSERFQSGKTTLKFQSVEL